MTQLSGQPDTVKATFGHDHEYLAKILDNGADANASDADKRTALHHAAINGDLLAVRLLLDAGAHVDLADANDWTPLHFAARDHQIGATTLLLDGSAAVDPEDTHGNTPLFRAVFESRGRGRMIQLLMRHGADASHLNRHGSSPSTLASTIANFDVNNWLT